MKHLAFFFIILFFMTMGSMVAQDRKTVSAVRAQGEIQIDGKLDEPDWRMTEHATDFTELRPNPGKICENQCRVKILYDDTGIYVGAELDESNFEKLGTELFERDAFDFNKKIDWFEVILDCYHQGLTGYGFAVTASGVQTDVKYEGSDVDLGWDAVWQSEISLQEHAWYCEIKIPYSALRFPDQNEHQWGIQFDKGSHQRQEESYWSPVDPAFDGLLPQSGVLVGIKDIKPPVRLSATPFFAVYAENFVDPKRSSSRSSWGSSYNGGMDVKYGISDAYTMDMTLVPDFGQVQSDNEVLNLSPFEVQFDENRQFFTEGTELFSKAGLFYSRRVGDTPFYYEEVYSSLGEEEVVAEIKRDSRLINATKISGRSKGGTGLGFFNAISPRDFAVIENVVTGEKRDVLLQPWTNYNVVVLDQSLKQNSYFSLINTNVMREGNARDANVTGLEFDLRDRKNKYGIYGSAAVSQKFESTEQDNGHRYNFGVERLSGKLTWGISHNLESDTYDNNDLGFMYNNNERSWSASMEYTEYDGFGPFLNAGLGMHIRYAGLYRYPGDPEGQFRPNLYTNGGINVWANGKFKNFCSLNIFFYAQPAKGYDYFEPRVPGRFFTYPAFNNVGLSFNTDTRKKLQTGFNIRFLKFHEKEKHQFEYGAYSNFRINNHFTVGYEFDGEYYTLDRGYITAIGNDIVFGARDYTDITQVVRATYTFNPRMAFSFRLRHNWTRVDYTHFYTLAFDGGIAEREYSENEDINFNAWTIDTNFRWRFAPGSDLYLVWKNAIFGQSHMSQISFSENLMELFDYPQSNSFSVKAIYYLDFQHL